MKKNIYTASLLLVIVSILLGCATIPVFRDRLSVADDIASKAGFNKEYIRAGDFTLLTYQKIAKPGEGIRIYIEGDGSAWETKIRLSDDPTPRQPIALYLAGEDPAGNVVYIARPGQYSQTGAPECDPSYWSDRRFSEEVIESMNEAVDRLSGQAGTSEINLIGYSGGAAVAVLVAARRTDIISLRTIAGNLDTDAVNRRHHVTPFKDSLNPIEAAGKIKDIPQRHFIGSKDKVVPSSVVESFMEAEGCKRGERITVVEGATHTTGWRERWGKLLLIPLATCSEKR